ncbi:MAG: S24/S26 family peptidase [Candidatus Moranbacteria bacterium]|nr:S24/S26 family peptidase [Candidatus Moranbacteria bacterium]
MGWRRSSLVEKIFAGLFLVMAAVLIFRMAEQKQRQDRLEYFVGQGDSMLPTIREGAELTVDPEARVSENDIIVFTCRKCKQKNDDIDILTKRLIAKNEKGCLWVEGDNKANSYDSRDFGWLCPEEIELHGVVIKRDQEED